MKRLGLFLFLALFATIAAQCEPQAAQKVAQVGPRTWIDAPLPNSNLPLASVEIISHSSDPLQIVQVELSVNGAVVRTDLNPDSQRTLATMRQPWMPPGPGNYTLMVRAQNSTGVWGDYATTVVTVGGAPGAPTPPTATPSLVPPPPPARGVTATPLPPTRTPTSIVPPPPTRTPTSIVPPPPTRTPTSIVPPPPAGCRGVPSIAFFSASPSSITAGQSATLSWGAVTNADSVEIDHGIGGVATPGSTSVSPATTTTYTLTARCGSNTKTQQVTVTVQTRVLPPPPSDTTGPTIDRIGTSNNFFYRSGCSPLSIQVTAHVTDPSGVVNVNLWYRVGSSGSFTSVSMDAIGSDTYRKTVNGSEVPGTSIGTWQFYITARDGASGLGNVSQSPTNTSVTLYSTCVR
jgi:hypothetical protein